MACFTESAGAHILILHGYGGVVLLLRLATVRLCAVAEILSVVHEPVWTVTLDGIVPSVSG